STGTRGMSRSLRVLTCQPRAGLFRTRSSPALRSRSSGNSRCVNSPVRKPVSISVRNRGNCQSSQASRKAFFFIRAEQDDRSRCLNGNAVDLQSMERVLRVRRQMAVPGREIEKGSATLQHVAKPFVHEEAFGRVGVAVRRDVQGAQIADEVHG